jgi:anaerobic selenocysteine-containing dehydrogenase
MFNYIRLSDGGESPPPGDLRSEVEVVCSLAARVLPAGPFSFAAMTDHRAVREAIARVVPGFDAIGHIDGSRREFQIEGRTFHEPRFATASGKARARVTPLPAFRPGPGEFRLMTLRSEGQFNTVVYETEDLYRGATRRDVVFMNAADAARLGLDEGAPVEVTTEAGRSASPSPTSICRQATSRCTFRKQMRSCRGGSIGRRERPRSSRWSPGWRRSALQLRDLLLAEHPLSEQPG